MMSARALRTLRPTLLASSSRPFTTTARVRAGSGSAFNSGKEDLGGPGGQQPIPPNPGGPEALRRNWCVFFHLTTLLPKPQEFPPILERCVLVIGGAALAVLVGYNWIYKNPDEARQQRDKTLGEMSGRNKTEMGGFRHD
ncbi:uncharacterized protein TRIREDRAFT_106591 [Trichoderma reesei QM6a]|uniref:Predicted protein n=1 Tax=Hypocrea jecorina (strain QM6a) TaxID=431241 RepID=G0RGU6_HYPJQ|nr:uncharacterized protein TRIREDRAFT_106591 [Trichoderma reesei QM6a]EGR49636.1 predicted protein [Trichoderma reesei QM6a]